MVVFGQNGCNQAKRLYSVKVDLFGQTSLYSVKNGCIRAKWFDSGEVVLFVQCGCILAKTV